MATEGDFVVVGSPMADGPDSMTSSGAAYVFLRNVSNNAEPWPLQRKLVPPAGVNLDKFGTSVSISGGAVALYKLNPVDP